MTPPNTEITPSRHTPETWELGYGRGITGPTACQWHYMPGWAHQFQIVTLPNSVSGDCNSVVAVIPKAQAKWEEYARLIAAAPDMLSALKDMVEIAQRDDWHNALSGRQIVLEAAELAISKAEKQP